MVSLQIFVLTLLNFIFFFDQRRIIQLGIILRSQILSSLLFCIEYRYITRVLGGSYLFFDFLLDWYDLLDFLFVKIIFTWIAITTTCRLHHVCFMLIRLFLFLICILAHELCQNVLSGILGQYCLF